MKVRSLKLREAHKSINGNNDNNPSFCSVLWDQQAHHLVTASSSDPSISIHDPLIPSNPPKILRHHRDGVTALALSPNSTCLASGSIDHSVKLYKFPSGEFETNVTRFTLPIRALAFNKSGSMVAAAGDDEGIKLINTIDGSIARVLKGHKGPVTGLAFDPINEYLATVDSVGTVLCWELQSGGILHTLKSVAPNNISDTSFMNVVSWSPDGETLAVPGLRNDVVMYDRDTAEKLFSLRGDHVQPVCYLSWSPNGKYMATSGLDRQILIWDVDKKQDIDRQKFEDRISGMAWKPIGNVLAVIDVMGKYGLWELEDPEPSTSGGLSEFAEDILCESEPCCRKRLRKQSESEDPDEDIDDELNLLPKTETRKKVHRASKDNLDKGNGLRNTVKMQEAFQPGATPPQRGKRRFLCYNMLGTITTVENDGYSHIEIDFHDTGRGPRLPSMTDYFGFTMASLNENGSVFANPCKGEKNMSTLMYRPFSSWANNSEWSMRFEGEEVKVVALGNAWVAAITSLNFLRIYTDGGLQRHIISLDGPVATASGFKNQLAVVTHVSDCLPSIDQMLEFRVFDISSGTQPLSGRLPLTPGSHLIWFGFSEEGQLSSYDSKGVLRVFTSQYGGSWLPVFSASKEKSDESYWVVGLNASKLFCISYKSPDKFPQVIPKPVLSLLNLSFPVASSDLGADALENEFILNSMHLSQIQKRMEDMAGACLDTTALDDEAFNMEATQDRCILRLIASCCNGDKLVRATELMKLLSLEKSMKGAIKLVTALKLPNLAERFNTILEERLVNESKGTHKSPLLSFNGCASLTADDAAISKMMVTSNGKNEKHESSIGFSSPALSAPLFIKKENKQEHEKSDQNQTTNAKTSMEPSYAEKVKSAENVLRVGEVKMTGQVLKVQSQRLSCPSLKSSNNQETTKKDLDQLASLRPSNPFKKAPN
ncbi:WD REPEAT AND HMG-BOX DNA BINDING PROTEIN [Salix purpurea]|uniref:WD REPEAT AND HMG-BOX DNA BINDING PROTEIN n=1 Tax=Salix purpurea TaxID=77065 RepID=A0A9Q0VIS8_SALPP|nr:WD REPEAT AND HMG-BOX DNA BINDING PROTEIN [Salix purpurea]